MQNILAKICNTKKDEIVEQKKFITRIFLLKASKKAAENKFPLKKKYSQT